MAQVSELVNYTNNLLEIGKFKDYCPNGLQVEGSNEVNLLVSGVTACAALLDVAIEKQADAILVHHGYFWKNEDTRITGIKRHRLQKILASNINLIAYHLPLDAHTIYGNNAQLGQILGLTSRGLFGNGGGIDIAMRGELAATMSGEEFAGYINAQLCRPPIHIAGSKKRIKTIGWCTGSAQSYIEKAAELGLDAYLSGEISEQTVHIARESGTHFFAAGHHATERYGVKALGRHLSEKFDLEHEFIDIDNPV
jgi:dinuclear metal center YbgI/SA1388 family protein